MLIPIINEGKRIHTELQRAKDSRISEYADIVVCDGGSTDGCTQENILRELDVNTLLVKRDTGKQGAQLRMGIWWAIQRGYQGVITIDGNNKDSIEDVPRFIEKLKEDELVKFRRENVGFIFQSFHLLGTMNALENVALPLTFRGEMRKTRMKKADRMLELVNLGRHKLHMPNQMSGGQQQRVGIARALVADPKIIFADEPTGNLDSHTSEEVMRLMQKIVREQGRTLVMVTHDPHEAEYADRVVHIIDGKIVRIQENRRDSENESK